MPTIISFSRCRIKENINAEKPSPPIRVNDGKKPYWTNGLKLSELADVVYKPHEEPSLFIETASRVKRTQKTVDQPRKEKSSTYIYIQLSWFQKNRKCPDGPLLPVITRHFFQDGRWSSECCYGLRIHGESFIEYSLGKTLAGKGVRLWVRTEADVTLIEGDWYPAILRECRERLDV